MKLAKKQITSFNKVCMSVAFLFMVFITPLSIEAVDKSFEKNIRSLESNSDINIEEKLPYTFNISDKLTGSGEVNLFIGKNKIKGSAIGIGMTCQCDVDLTTNIDGLFSDLEYISVIVSGIGDPKGLIPGKISFSGPLKGEVSKGKISLVGNVNIEGKLAKLAGFNEVEEVVIEIPATTLIQAYKEKTKEQNIALYH